MRAPQLLGATLDLLRYLVGLACRRETLASEKGEGMLATPVSILTPVPIPVPILGRSAKDEREYKDSKDWGTHYGGVG